MRFGGRSISRFRSGRAVERAWVCQHSGRPAMNDVVREGVPRAGASTKGTSSESKTSSRQRSSMLASAKRRTRKVPSPSSSRLRCRIHWRAVSGSSSRAGDSARGMSSLSNDATPSASSRLSQSTCSAPGQRSANHRAVGQKKG
jgi:hypothetical protein